MNGPFALPGSSPSHEVERHLREGWLPRGWIDGLTLSNDTTDATNDIGIAAGVARSTVRLVDGTPSTLARDQIDLELPVGIIKQLDVAFAPENYDPDGYSGGDRSGGRSSTSLSNATWHALLVGGNGLQPDVLLHNSLTQSSVLAEMQKIGGYTAYRNIMSIVRASAAIRAFTQLGNNVLWSLPIMDVDNSSTGTSANLGTLSVPIGLKLPVWVNVYYSVGGGTIYLSSPDQTDMAASITAAPLSHIFDTIDAAGGQLSTYTDTSGQIRYRTANTGTVRIATLGFVHPRGRDA